MDKETKDDHLNLYLKKRIDDLEIKVNRMYDVFKNCGVMISGSDRVQFDEVDTKKCRYRDPFDV